MTSTPPRRPRKTHRSLSQHRATPFVFCGVVLATISVLGMRLDGGQLLNGHHGPATVLLVFGLPIMAALFLYDPAIRLLDRIFNRTR